MTDPKPNTRSVKGWPAVILFMIPMLIGWFMLGKWVLIGIGVL